jgi:hypothetical protein
MSQFMAFPFGMIRNFSGLLTTMVCHAPESAAGEPPFEEDRYADPA